MARLTGTFVGVLDTWSTKNWSLQQSIRLKATTVAAPCLQCLSPTLRRHSVVTLQCAIKNSGENEEEDDSSRDARQRRRRLFSSSVDDDGSGVDGSSGQCAAGIHDRQHAPSGASAAESSVGIIRPPSARVATQSGRGRRMSAAEERARIADAKAERRAVAKARSEAIPEQPKKHEDRVIFSALHREWDDAASDEERRGARAAVRQVARIGQGNPKQSSLRSVRRRLIQAGAAAARAGSHQDKETDKELLLLARRAAAQVAAAAAVSTQRPTAELAAEAAGVKRSYARAEALPAGEWERLRAAIADSPPAIKIGRRGATPALVAAIASMWRKNELVKLRIHDDRSSRQVNLPRINLLLQELEEASGGVLIDTSGSSIWMYRGPHWVPPPKVVHKPPPPPSALLRQVYEPCGSWQDIGGVSCYLVGEEVTAAAAAAAAGESKRPEAPMTVLMLPDQFPLADSPLTCQVADRIAAQTGALVVLADLLGPPASHPEGAVQLRALPGYCRAAGYWQMNKWPVVKQRKIAYTEWYTAGAGSWLQQRSKLLGVLEGLAQQGLCDPAAGAAAAVRAARLAAGAKARSSSSSSSGRALGLLGLGWGSYITLCAAGDAAVADAGAVAAVALSPTTYGRDLDLAQLLKLPVALLPARFDTMEQLMLAIDLLRPPFAPRCVFKRYGKIKPGWASWLPQWNDNRAMLQVAEVLEVVVAYLRRELGGAPSAGLPPPEYTPVAEGSGAAKARDAARTAAAAVRKQQDTAATSGKGVRG